MIIRMIVAIPRDSSGHLFFPAFGDLRMAMQVAIQVVPY